MENNRHVLLLFCSYHVPREEKNPLVEYFQESSKFSSCCPRTGAARSVFWATPHPRHFNAPTLKEKNLINCSSPFTEIRTELPPRQNITFQESNLSLTYDSAAKIERLTHSLKAKKSRHVVRTLYW